MSLRDEDDLGKIGGGWRRTRILDVLHALPDDHPVHIALRTYALSLSFSLGPSLFSVLTSGKIRRNGFGPLIRILRRELGASGFAFAMTAGVGGGAALKQLWDILERWHLSIPNDQSTNQHSILSRITSFVASLQDSQKAFVANTLSALLAFRLLQSGRRERPASHQAASVQARASVTLDLTLLLFVRAMDSVVRATFFPNVRSADKSGESREVEDAGVRRRRLTARLDALIFWASSARFVVMSLFWLDVSNFLSRPPLRIMWCFFYEPRR